MKTYKLVGIGNAVVDVITHADESFLEMMGIEKGIMQLVEMERSELLYAAMKQRVQTPGGAVAKITGKEGLKFTGPAAVFDSEELALQAILNGDIVGGDIVGSDIAGAAW